LPEAGNPGVDGIEIDVSLRQCCARGARDERNEGLEHGHVVARGERRAPRLKDAVLLSNSAIFTRDHVIVRKQRRCSVGQARLVTSCPSLPDAIPAEIERLLERNPRRDVARAALEANGAIVVVPTLADAAAVADLRAPEHLELLVAEPLALAGRIRNAGAIFLGAHSPEPMGDYFAGPNHVLPTGGTARFASPLGVYDFVKRTSLIGYSPERLRAHAGDVIRLAEAEGLHGHAEAIRVRLEDS
jgi:hypothetical protein